MQHRKAIFFTLVFFIFVYILPLGVRPIFVDDEARYAEIPREMITSGDWIVPRLNGLRYFEKPVMGYWLNGASILLFGENAFAVRLPSALAAGLSALLVFLLLRCRVSKDDQLTPPLGALIFLSCFAVITIGTFAALDSMLSFFLTGAMFFFFFAVTSEPGSGREKWMLAVAGFFTGSAFLIKGFLVFVVLGLSLGGFLIWQRRFKDLFRMVWLPLAVAILTALPWGIMIHLREPDYWNYFFWNEHVRRFLSHDAQHNEPFWYFMAIAPAMCLPWTSVLPAAVSGLRKKIPQQNDLFRFSLCWLVLPFLFFSASKGKLITYILPCFPPFAILVSLGLSRYFEKERLKLFNWGALAAALVFGIVLLIFTAIHLVNINNLYVYSSTAGWLAVAGGTAAICSFLILAARSRRHDWKIIFVGLSPALLFFALQFNIPDRALQSKDMASLLEQHSSEVTPGTIILAGGNTSRTTCWVFKRDDVYLVSRAAELEYGVNHDESGGRLLAVPEAAEMITKNHGKIILVARKRDYENWLPSLPAPTEVYSSGPNGYVFLKY